MRHHKCHHDARVPALQLLTYQFGHTTPSTPAANGWGLLRVADAAVIVPFLSAFFVPLKPRRGLGAILQH